MSNMKTNFKNNLKNIINASGKMTKLGVSTQSKYVREQMLYATQNYFDMDELYSKSGAYIASLLDAEDCVVTSSASAAIVFIVASLICGSNDRLIENINIEKDFIDKREVIIPKGHSVNYGVAIHTMIELGAGKVIEAGNSNMVTKNEVESCINKNTLALFYVKSHHAVQKNMITIDEMLELSKKHNIPMIIDAAAEEDFTSYYKKGIDFIIYSGAKALSGPSSGFVLCKNKTHASNMRKQYYGIGRSMKIGKENIFGLVASIEEYIQNNGPKINVTYEDLEEIVSKFNKIEGIKSEIVQDEAGRKIYRCKINIDEKKFGLNAKEVNIKLNLGSPAIFCRDYESNLGNLYFDPRPLINKNQLESIYERILEIGEK